MNHRQWKKAYKKRYGHNPSTMEDRSRASKELAKTVSKVIEVLPKVVKSVINIIADIFDETGKGFMSIAADMRGENSNGAGGATMSRLIDADELLLKFNKAYDEVDAQYHESDFDSFYGGGCSMIQEVIKEITEQPTAYDIDKVVEQLDELKSQVPVNRILDDIIKDKPKELGQLIAYNKAIEIVKAGGKSDRTEIIKDN